MNLFNLEDKNLIKACVPILKKLYEENKRTYINLFFYEKDITFDDFDLTPLVKTEIVRKIGDTYRANVQIFPLSGKFICTDFNYSKHRKVGNTYTTQKNGVWGILPEETPIIAKAVKVHRGDFVLDLATGSGMIAIFCADKAKKVIATDINSRCINYGIFNAILNNVEEKIEFRTGDLFEPARGLKFDLIIWNGPTVAVPETPEKYPVYSYGGMDGAEFTKKFIDQVFTYLKKAGRLQWYDCAVGTSKLPVSMTYLKQKWQDKKIKVVCNCLTSSPVSLKKVFDFYAKYNLENPKFKTPLSTRLITLLEEKQWHKWLKDRKYTHLYYSLVEVNPSNKFQFEMNFPKKDLRTDRYLTRYWLWMPYTFLTKSLANTETH